MSRVLALFIAVASAQPPVVAVKPFESTCGSNSSAVADCDHPDLGSCGDACCIIETELQTSGDLAYGEIVAFLSTGGGDGSYSYSNGTDAAGHRPMPAQPRRGNVRLDAT